MLKRINSWLVHVQRDILELFWNQQLVEIYNTSGSFPIKIIIYLFLVSLIKLLIYASKFLFFFFGVIVNISRTAYIFDLSISSALKIIVLFPMH